MSDFRPGFGIQDEFSMDKLSYLKYRPEVQLLPDIAGIGVDGFGRQVNFPGRCPGVRRWWSGGSPA